MYYGRTNRIHGKEMRISLTDSRTNGFKKWSDAHCSADPTAPADMPERHAEDSALGAPDADPGGNPE